MDAASGLRLHRLLMRAALSAANLFGWIFVFEFFYIATGALVIALARTALLYALAQLIACLLVPLSARWLGNGLKREMTFGALAAAAAFVFLGALFQGVFAGFITVAIVLFALFLGMYRALYWVPYGVEREQGNGRSRLSYEIVVALMPAFAGALLVLPGNSESLVLFAAAFVIALSLTPLAPVPETYERFHMTYREAFGALAARAHRRVAWSAFVDGVQGAAFLLFWPIALFLLVGWSYPMLGIIFSITCLFLLLVRALISPRKQRRMPSVSPAVRVAIVSSAWIGRLTVAGPIGAAIADSYLHLGDGKNNLDHLAFEQLSDAGHYIDEYTVVREIGLALGRIALCVAIVLAAAFCALPFVFGVAFVLAGISAGVSVLLSKTSLKSI